MNVLLVILGILTLAGLTLVTLGAVHAWKHGVPTEAPKKTTEEK